MKRDYELNPTSPATLGGTWYGLIKSNAECACRYSDVGGWGTLMFQITGERRYAQLAWQKIESWFLPMPTSELGGNFAREYSAEMVLFYDWLYPGLTQEQRDRFLAKINDVFRVIVSGNQWISPEFPVRTEDSDLTVGSYFGLAFLYLATADHNPLAEDYFSRPWVGGFSVTADDRSTARNAIADYVKEAAGGEWIESSDYNLGTLQLLLMGAEGIRTATKTNHFPEISRFAAHLAWRQLHLVTPDRKQSVQWGDEEHPREFSSTLWKWQGANGLIAGSLAPRTPAALAINYFVHDLVKRYGSVGYNTAEPWSRFFFTFNPYAARFGEQTIAWLNRGWFAPGQGMLSYRTSWAPDATMFTAHMAERPRVDHEVGYLGDFQLYRKGTWAITHPLSYAGPSVTGRDGTNTLLHAGFGSAVEFRKALAQQHDALGRWAYVAGTTGGTQVWTGYYDPPPTFLHEWTRSLLYLSSRSGTSDTIVVYDRSHAEDPRELPKFERYYPPERARVTEAPALKQWIIHMPVEPSVGPEDITWTVDTRQRARVQTLLPTHRDVLVFDERQIWASDTSTTPAEKKWQARVVPTIHKPWDTFLHVVQVHDAGAVLSNELLGNTVDNVEGVLVRRQGEADVVAIFNATPSGRLQPEPYDADTASALERVRLRTAGFTMTWTSVTLGTEVFLLDLHPDQLWSASIDGGQQVPLAVSSAGLARTIVRGEGPHTIAVTSNSVQRAGAR